MRRSILCVTIPMLLSAALLGGCGGEGDPPGPPTEGEALKKHLLGILAQRHEALLAGDLNKARSFLLPYMRDEQKATAIWAGWDPDAATVPDSVIQDVKRRGPSFKPGKPIKLETHDRWARLTQQQTDHLGQKNVMRGYFLRDDGRWWIVKVVVSSSAGIGSDRFAYAEAETYWPDRMAEYFFLPPVELKLELVGKAESSWEDFRVRASVRNVSSRPISKTQMRRFFTTVNYSNGKMNTARAPRGEGVDPGYGPLPPGQTLVLGEFDVSYPTRDREKGVLWQESRYLSNRLILPSPAR